MYVGLAKTGRMTADGTVIVYHAKHTKSAAPGMRLLSAIAEETFRDTFSGMNKPEDMDLQTWFGLAMERNPRAIAFYEKFDFREVGEHVFRVGTDPQRDIVMARPVVP